jgi:hypothetical protein
MSNIQDAMNLLFPAHRQQVLAALLLEPARSLHLRELARLVGSHAGTLAREVDKLTQAGLLLRTDQGNQAHYRANVQHPLFPELAALLRKTHGVVPALRTALQPLADRIALAFVYGSVASGTASEHSDVDVLLVGSGGLRGRGAGALPAARATGPRGEPGHLGAARAGRQGPRGRCLRARRAAQTQVVDSGRRA